MGAGSIEWRSGFLDRGDAMRRRLEEVDLQYRRTALASRCAKAVIEALSSRIQIEAQMGEGMTAFPTVAGQASATVASACADYVLRADVDDDRIAVDVAVSPPTREGASAAAPFRATGRVEVDSIRRDSPDDPNADVIFSITCRTDLGTDGTGEKEHRIRGLPEDLGASLLALAFRDVVPVLSAWRGAEVARRRRATGGARDAARRAAPSAGETRIQLYDVGDVARTLDQVEDEWIDADTPPMPRTPSEDAARVRRRAILAKGRDGSTRALAHADASMVRRLDEAAARAPHLEAFTSLMRRQILASIATGTPIAMSPVLLVGEPGTGKSWLLRTLCSILGLPFQRSQMNVTSLSEGWSGTAPTWKGASEGVVARTLLGERIANPLMVVDEFDKTAAHSHNADPYRAFYTLFESENAEAFPDDFLGFPIDASHVLWVATANDAGMLPRPIADRLRILDVPDIPPDAMRPIALSIYRELNVKYAAWFEPELPEDLLEALCQRTPRRAKITLYDAMTRAAADSRRVPRLSDLAGDERRVRTYGFSAAR